MKAVLVEVQQGAQLVRAGNGLVQGANAQGQATLPPPVGYQQGLPLTHLHPHNHCAHSRHRARSEQLEQCASNPQCRQPLIQGLTWTFAKFAFPKHTYSSEARTLERTMVKTEL